ncbi:hypothetical protein FF1_014432 [Malus domestica]
MTTYLVLTGGETGKASGEIQSTGLQHHRSDNPNIWKGIAYRPFGVSAVTAAAKTAAAVAVAVTKTGAQRRGQDHLSWRPSSLDGRDLPSRMLCAHWTMVSFMIVRGEF